MFQIGREIEETEEEINFFFPNMMPTMPPDSHKISLKIIEAVKQHPVLFINDVKGTSIKVQEFRQKVWKRISDELGLDRKSRTERERILSWWNLLTQSFCSCLGETEMEESSRHVLPHLEVQKQNGEGRTTKEVDIRGPSELSQIPVSRISRSFILRQEYSENVYIIQELFFVLLLIS